MMLTRFLAGVAMCAASTFLLVSCQKDETIEHTNPVTLNTAKLSGVAEDDPILVAKVPMIVSSDFLRASKDLAPDILFARGKPIKVITTGDNTLPTVSITAPTGGASVSGYITIQASASDNVGVTLVTFQIDGSTIGSDNSAPYSLGWNSATVSNGSHNITAIAVDAAGNSKSVIASVVINNVTAGDVTPPSVNITSPGNGTSVSGSVNIQANASDNVGVSSVSFSIDGNLVATDNSAPYSFAWNSASVPTGIHTLGATSRDAAGNSAAHSLQVTVNTVVVPPSTVPASFQMMMPPASHQGSEGSCVSFAVGYAARSAEQFYRSNASSYSNATNIFSPEFLFNLTTSDSYCSSSALISALETLKNVGICTWQSMPYSSADGCSTAPSSSQNSEAAMYKIASYSGIYTSDLTAIKTMLAAKRPLMITFAIDANFSNAGPGFIWSSYASANGARHAVTICGYDDSKNAVKIMNSWGPTWGDNGFSWIDYNFLRTLNPTVYVMNF